jgi:hypothetical protein
MLHPTRLSVSRGTLGRLAELHVEATGSCAGSGLSGTLESSPNSQQLWAGFGTTGDRSADTGKLGAMQL